jgi:hypothetical protein
MNTSMLQKLPELGQPTSARLPQSIRDGFMVYSSQRFLLIKVHFEGAGRNLHYRPAPGINLGLKNSSKRRLFNFDADHAKFQKTVNRQLAGGESYPILTGLLSIGAGIASFGAGTVFTLVTAAADSGRQVQTVMARLGDELWQVELVGKKKGKIVHVEYFVLWDPYRRDAEVPSDFIIHEERREVVV